MKRPLSVAMAALLLGVGGGTSLQAVVSASAHAATVSCPPGAFDDTDGVVKVIDKTIAKEMKRIESAIDARMLNPGDSKTHGKTLSTGVIVQTTLTRSADGNTYTYELDMAQPSPTPAFVVVATGSRTNGGIVAGVHTVTKQIHMDYNARGTFVPTKPTGEFSATIVHVNDPSKPAPGNQDTLSVAFNDITIKPTDRHGPRTGAYTHTGEAAIGGSLEFHASIPVPCPGDPAGPVEITVQRRHVDDATGERTYRRDALVTGGSLAAGETAIGFTCGTNTPSGSTIIQSSYRLLKIENPDGSTQSYTEKLKNETAPDCNPAFGAMVSPNNNTTDSAFSSPVTFPGEW